MDGRTCKLHCKPIGPTCANDLHDFHDDVFSRNAGRDVSVNSYAHSFHAFVTKGLSRKHMLHFRRADAKAQCAVSPISGGMAVATSDQHTRCNQPLFGNHDVFDTLSRVAEAVKGDAVFAAI